MKKLTFYSICTGMSPLVLAEVTLRVLNQTRPITSTICFGKRSYFLPPFHVPQQVPAVDTAIVAELQCVRSSSWVGV
jgi:hypothetical protein